MNATTHSTRGTLALAIVLLLAAAVLLLAGCSGWECPFGEGCFDQPTPEVTLTMPPVPDCGQPDTLIWKVYNDPAVFDGWTFDGQPAQLEVDTLFLTMEPGSYKVFAARKGEEVKPINLFKCETGEFLISFDHLTP